MEDPWCLSLGVPRHRSWDKNLSTSQSIWGVKPGKIDPGVGEIGKEDRREGRKEERENKGRETPGCVQATPGLEGWERWGREEGRRRGWMLTCVRGRTGRRKPGSSAFLFGFLLDWW